MKTAGRTGVRLTVHRRPRGAAFLIGTSVLALSAAFGISAPATATAAVPIAAVAEPGAAELPPQEVELPAPPAPPAGIPASQVLDDTPAPESTPSAPSAPRAGTLVLFDRSGPWGYLGDLYGQMAGNLTSRFGTWEGKPVAEYQAGEMTRYKSVVYIGSTYDEVVPVEFLDDVLAARAPVMWMANNIWQLDARAAQDAIPGNFSDQFGWSFRAFDTSVVGHVTYKGRELDRFAANAGGILDVNLADPDRVEVLATAQREDDTEFPWAVRSGSLTFLGEIPFSYISESDRYLIFADLLFDALEPTAPERHRALIRFEDVSPYSDPDELRALGETLYERGIPFSVAFFPVHVDPANGIRLTMADRPEVLDALRYLSTHGGTVIQHGYTHQLGSTPNPYNGASGEDFEFFSAHVDQNDYVIYDGPVPGDSTDWARDRMAQAASATVAAGLPAPQIWEFPHYAASAADYAAAAQSYGARYERGLYFAGKLSGDTANQSQYAGQFFPYEVTDVYGSRVLPENLGNVQLEGYNHHAPVLPEDIVERAEANRVVRDGFASLFFHTFYEPELLNEVVDGIRSAGYTFVSPSQVLSEFPGSPVAAPVAPTGLRATVRDRQASLTFVPPTAVAGAPVVNYEYSTNNGNTWTTAFPATASSALTVGGLTNGRAYQMRVRAVNIAGVGAPSAPLKVTPKISVPTAPTAVKAVAGDSQATVNFAPPGSDGGSEILGYQLSTDDGATWSPTRAGAVPIVASGIVNGIAYPLRVRALNAAGAGRASARVLVTPRAPVVPSAPTALSVAAGDGSASVSFGVPRSDGGAPIVSYEVSIDDGRTWFAASGEPISPLTVGNLTNGRSYRLRLRAVNSVGPGSASARVSVVPRAG